MTKTLLTAVVLALAPALSASAACWTGHTDQTATSCAEGMVYDAEAGTCVEQVTG
ncbi:adenylosuccinate lyase [Tranquillimonas alkanivorans]|uniref:Chitin binding Peritrophin-A domain-containing protein n=1 Tax=Tranquillimonas alkanivorans TaxID=441119 RepID=A0A1I5QUY9_9RHOB|nr:adenylosuccinate lyase [Tranquillimonas alkanivorans]SFP49907.1 hypothetical protein SAMN04488047_107115 [Tranquillimonas alkanivorans]